MLIALYTTTPTFCWYFDRKFFQTYSFPLCHCSCLPLSSSWFYFHAIQCYSYANIAMSQATNDVGKHVKSFSICTLKFGNSPLGHHWLSGQLQNKTFFISSGILFAVNYVVLVLYWSQQCPKTFFFFVLMDRSEMFFLHFSISDVDMYNTWAITAENSLFMLADSKQIEIDVYNWNRVNFSSRCHFEARIQRIFNRIWWKEKKCVLWNCW